MNSNLEITQLYRTFLVGPRPPRFLKPGFPSARFCSETDFCPFAVLIAAQMEVSIWVSSAPIAERNILRSRCNSASQLRPPDRSTSATASLIASRIVRLNLCTRGFSISFGHHWIGWMTFSKRGIRETLRTPVSCVYLSEGKRWQKSSQRQHQGEQL